MDDQRKRLAVRTGALCAALFVIGISSKFYRGPMHLWVNNSLSGVLYEVFWCLAVSLVIPRARPVAVAAGVFVATAALEVLQLWHPPFLQSVRATFFGAAFIGTTFVWSDFFYYIAGCAVAFVAMKRLVASY